MNIIMLKYDTIYVEYDGNKWHLLTFQGYASIGAVYNGMYFTQRIYILKASKTDNFELKIVQLTPFIGRPFQDLNLVTFKYDTIYVEYCDIFMYKGSTIRHRKVTIFYKDGGLFDQNRFN